MADRKTVDIKLGLNLPDVIDFRTIPLRSILKLAELPPLPDGYDVDTAVGGIRDDFVYGNDLYPNCVKAAMAHQTLRFEKFEQGVQIEITDSEVINEYERERIGDMDGLYLTYAMRDWRKLGVDFGGKHYDIYAFAEVTPKDHIQVKYSIFLLNGIIFGMQLYDTDIEQFRNDEGWHLTSDSGQFQGGHGVYAFRYKDSDEITFVSECGSGGQGVGYARLPHLSRVIEWDDKGVTCVTWGVEQFMTWDFWDARVTQAYAVVDNRDKWLGDKSPVNVALLDSYLREITGDGTPANTGCAFPFPKIFCKR